MSLTRAFGAPFTTTSPSNKHLDRSADAGLIAELLNSAEAVDDGDLYNYYKTDERTVAIYQGLFYSKERLEWLARFVPAHPEQAADPSPSDVNYAEVLRRGKILHASKIKPSQSTKAIAAFNDQLDIAASDIHFDA